MIVCQCKGTTDSVLRKAVRDGATTIGAVGVACAAGTECEGCHATITKIIADEHSAGRAQTAREPLLSPADKI